MAVGRISYQTAFAFNQEWITVEFGLGYESERFHDLKPPGIPGVSMLGPVVRKGDVVTDFELPDETGAPRRLSGLLADGPVVLFFYPAAMSLGCTVESCHFRDLIGEFKAVGAQPVGISADKGGAAAALCRETFTGLS